MVGPVRVDGLSSGIDYTSIIEKMMALQRAPITRFQGRVVEITDTQTSLLQVNANLLSLKSVASSLSKPSLFLRTKANSSNESVLKASGDLIGATGAYSFSVRRLAQSHQLMSNGFADANTTPVTTSDSFIRMELGGGHLQRRTHTSFLNLQQGMDRGSIQVTDSSGTTSVIDLAHALDVQDVVDGINENTSLSIEASVAGDKLVVKDTAGGTGTLSILNFGSDSTATSLGLDIASQTVGGTQYVYGKDINTVNGDTSLDLLNDGMGIRFTGTAVDDIKITNSTGLTSFTVDFQSDDTTIQDVIDRINTAGSAAGVTASLSETSIVLTDTAGGAGGITVSAVSSSFAAVDLGFGKFEVATGNFNSLATETVTGGKQIYGERLIPTLNGTQRNLFNGGQTNSTAGELKGVRNGSVQFTDRAGNSTILDLSSRVSTSVSASASSSSFTLGSVSGFSVGNLIRFQTSAGAEERTVTSVDSLASTVTLDQALTGTALGGNVHAVTESSQDLMRLVNNRLSEAGVNIKMGFNPVSNGFRLTDTSGGSGTLAVADTGGTFAGSDLGILGSVSANTIDGSDIDIQFLSERTRLSTMNGGKGVQAGKFQVFDTDSIQFTVDLGQPDDVILAEVIKDGNGAATAAGSNVRFRINDSGDGLLVYTNGTPGGGTLRIQEVNSGRLARDLNIEGTADSASPSEIDGTFEHRIKIGANSTLEDVAKAINQQSLGVQAAVISDGSPINPNRISLVSTKSGQAGRLVVDSDIAGLSFGTTAAAQNSVLLYGTNGGSGDPAVITSTNNHVTDIVQGMSLEFISASSSPVTVTVSRDLENVEAQAASLVEKYNDVISKFKELTYFDPSSYTTGPLFGDPTVRRIEAEMGGMVTLPVEGVPSFDLNTMTSLGFSTTSEGGMTLDTGAFSSALQNNFDEVVTLFTKQKPIQLNTKLSELSNGRGIDNVNGEDFTVLARDGLTKFAIDLDDNETISSLLLKINTHVDNNGVLTASIGSDGYSIQIDDNSSITSRLASAGSTTTFKIQESDLSGLTDDRIIGSTITFGAGSNNPGEVREIIGYTPGPGSTGNEYEIELDSPLNIAVGQNDAYTLERELQVEAVGAAPGAAQLKILQKLSLGKNSLEGGILNLDGDPGVAARMVEKLDYFTRSGDGLISTRTDSLDDTIDGLNTSIERIEDRVEREEQRLVREFARLEIILAESQTTMSNIQSSLLAFVSSMKTSKK